MSLLAFQDIVLNVRRAGYLKWRTSVTTLTVPLVRGSCTVASQVANGTSSNNQAEQARIAFSHTLPHLDGAHLKATVVEITYGRSESSPLTVTFAPSSAMSSRGHFGHK